MRKISVMNYKGGTGKTSTTVHLAHGLARQGKSVLVIDMDPQGSVGCMLGINSDVGVYDLLMSNMSWKECISSARENLDIITANDRLFPAAMALAQMPRREHVLQDKLSSLEGYDYVFVDSAPSFNILNQNALMFSDEIFMPVSMDFMSLVGVKQLLKNIQLINQLLKKAITVSKVIPTFYDKRNRKSEDVIASLERVFPGKLPKRPIRLCVDLSNAPSFGQTVFEYNLKSKSVVDYQQLINEVLVNGKKNER